MSDSVWEEAFDETSGRAYYFNRLTGDTSWTLPGESTAETNPTGSLWQQAFDEASQTTYYYNIHTGETSWTLPEDTDEVEEDLTYLEFAVVRLQAMFHGHKDRKRVRRIVRAQYQLTLDPSSGKTLYTNLKSNTSFWTKPALFRTLGIPDDGGGDDNENDDDDEDDDDDFDSFQRDAARDAEEEEAAGALAANDDGEPEDDEETSKKKRRKLPRSKAQQIVDAAEDSTDKVHTLTLSGLDAWKLSSRIWNLQHLQTLVLSHNCLERIPSGIQDLIHLEMLDVSYNQLTRLPSCLQTTTTLREIRASHNLIQTFSPKLWKLREIRHLDLSHNRMKELPYVEGDLKLLRETREWQVGVGLLENLEVLLLNDNRLTEAPKSIEKCGVLALLDLSNNQLTSLSNEIPALASLTKFSAHHNVIRVLPKSIGDLSNLQEMDLAHNRLATLPDSIGTLHKLETLQLSDNQLQKLPVDFGALTQLRQLNLDNNAKLINLDAFFRHLTSISTFSASSCGIVMFESSDFLKDSPVQTLRLRQNALLEFPLLIGHATMQDTLQELVLADNYLTQVPLAVLLYCSQLQHLDLSNNSLCVLPTEIAHLRRLEVLYLHTNALQVLPDELTQLIRLRDLRCDHNKIDALPLRIGKLMQLSKLNVSFNQLKSLPTSVIDLTKLQSLYASDNLLVTAPPAIYRMKCFCDFSNNPFTEQQHKRVQDRHDRIALASRLIDTGDFTRAEQILSELLVDANNLSFVEQNVQTPLLHYKRGLCRYMLSKSARQTINETSAIVATCERDINGSELVHARQVRLKLKQQNRGEQPEAPAKENIPPKSLVDNNSTEPDDTVKSNYLQAVENRSTAREQHHTFAHGSLKDLDIATQFGSVELTTAYHLKGLVQMALLQYAEAVDSFTKALQNVHAPLPGPEPTDNQKEAQLEDASELPLTIPEPSIHLFLCRAEAYRGLGQLPSAIIDLHHVVSRYPIQHDSSKVQALENEYVREWEAQQSACGLDDAALLRAFNVEASTGLARRPEVVDVHTEALSAANSKKKNAKSNTQIKAKRLPPHERFRLECEAKTEALVAEKQQRRAPFDAINARSQVFLARARDFKREVRAALEMELEENRQRRVEQEIAREAERKRLEMRREFDERMVMKYEDEWMHWFLSEELRLEDERRRRAEEAQRKADAKVAYAARLAKRGGKRQAAASRGRGSPKRK